MARILNDLLQKNREWASGVQSRDPQFFSSLSQQQAPKYLWIGCADSRVPANELVGLRPGELFVQRNVANMVAHSDLNCLSVLQYAIDHLAVEHVIVVGHIGCGGVFAALKDLKIGLAGNWVRHVRDVIDRHGEWIDTLPVNRQWPAACELNVLDQALNVTNTSVVVEAWERKQSVTVHAWIYDLGNGILQDLQFSADSSAVVRNTYQKALQGLKNRYLQEASLP
ncbi:carbonate dehydratase [Herbaspirillum sp. 1130]|uniref:carbonate dehydratase n=1 Tax=Herbaspirillum sp. 1130 TaxID=2806562 RepID=UPI001AE8BDF7|nr:carbonate dehydratase [Herbaspirillum sp. 1130]MBP1318299.1 carbonic anhydrase [Herbaspirillum sp. 1130]